MAWTVSFGEDAKKSLKQLDRQVAKRLTRFMRERVAVADDPRTLGRALGGDLSGFWRYRVGDYRIICELHDDVLVVLVIDVGHRKEVYKSN